MQGRGEQICWIDKLRGNHRAVIGRRCTIKLNGSRRSKGEGRDGKEDGWLAASYVSMYELRAAQGEGKGKATVVLQLFMTS